MKLWKWQGPQRIGILLWKMLNDALLTNENRRRRHLTVDDGCPLCNGNETKSILYTFRDCQHAQQEQGSLRGRTLECLCFYKDDMEEV
ncbi:hypothetical protein RIF29_14170 [Crotalaria pallida]|uniref:Reverse transcriptase zinc-binding domain-containing protein n=1 Tax=Crotalaria pallida TaxID=3830 RepID=A0AAN9FCU8_CROPI